MPRKIWVRTPTAGGRSIPEAVRRQTEERILRHAERRFRGKYTWLDVRFRGKFCYVDAYTEPAVPKRLPRGFPRTREQHIERLRATPTHLCRLRYFGEDQWSFAMYSYSHERYEDSCLPSGDFWCLPVEAFDVAASLHLS